MLGRFAWANASDPAAAQSQNARIAARKRFTRFTGQASLQCWTQLNWSDRSSQYFLTSPGRRVDRLQSGMRWTYPAVATLGLALLASACNRPAQSSVKAAAARCVKSA